MRRHLLQGVFATEAGKLARIYQHTFCRSEGYLLHVDRFGSFSTRTFTASARLNHLPNLQPILRRKFVVAFIMSRHRHDRPGSIVHQNVVRDPDRHTLAVKGIDGKTSSRNAVFFNRSNIADLASFPLLRNQLVDLRSQLRTGRR